MLKPLRKYHAAADHLTSHVASLRLVVAVLAVLCLGLGIALVTTSKDVRISLPPVLNFGASIKPGVIQPHEVYSFTGYIYQQMNTWRQDGEVDFPQNLTNLRFLLTNDGKNYFSQLIADLENEDQLGGRTRFIVPLGNYEASMVKVVGTNNWIVKLRYALRETLNDIIIKDWITLEVQLPVRYENKDPEYNPWGLWLGAPIAAPQRIAENTR